MDYYTIAGMVIVAVLAFLGSYYSIKKNAVDDRKPLEDLNINITKLNVNFEHMMENDDIRDARLKKHGEEIDSIKERQRSNERVLDRHESRLDILEGKLK